MKPDQITYLTEPGEAYRKGLDDATSLAELKAHVHAWKALFPDAWKAVGKLTEADFPAFPTAMKRERRKLYMGDEAAERFSAIILPEVLMATLLVADEFSVPWGCAFIRLREAGKIAIRDGSCHLVDEP
jgi:hypothetical protein